MPKISKILKRRKKTRESAMHIQVHFLAQVPRGVTLTKEFLNEVWSQWLETGHTPARIQIQAINWQAGRRTGSARGSKATADARNKLQAVFRSATVSTSAKRSKRA